MRNLAVFALELSDERERGARGGKIACGVQSQISPKRIAPEKPGEAGALALAGSAVSGDEPGAEKRIGHESLEFAHARPVVGLLELHVRKL